jgi:hypothetical protein
MVNKIYQRKYEGVKEGVGNFIYNTFEGLYDIVSPKTAFDGSKRSTLLDKTSEFPLEVVDTRKDKD